MSLRIACDLDGTLADMDAALQREAERLFGPDVDLHASTAGRIESAEDVEEEIAAAPSANDEPPTDNATRRALTRAELRKLWSHIGQVNDFWVSLGEIEAGAVAKLAACAVRHRWDIIFVTQRPSSAGDTTQRQSQRWLQTHGFECPSVFVTGSRGRVAHALSLDAVLDDRPDNCLDVTTDSKATPFLVWRHRRESLPPGVAQTRIQTVFSIGEALERLEQMTTTRLRSQTFLGRVRNAVGI
jgi:hypothetical protein